MSLYTQCKSTTSEESRHVDQSYSNIIFQQIKIVFYTQEGHQHPRISSELFDHEQKVTLSYLQQTYKIPLSFRIRNCLIHGCVKPGTPAQVRLRKSYFFRYIAAVSIPPRAAGAALPHVNFTPSNSWSRLCDVIANASIRSGRPSYELLTDNDHL